MNTKCHLDSEGREWKRSSYVTILGCWTFRGAVEKLMNMYEKPRQGWYFELYSKERPHIFAKAYFVIRVRHNKPLRHKGLNK